MFIVFFVFFYVGEVFRGYYKGEEVAIKVLKSSETEKEIEEFKKEFAILMYIFYCFFYFLLVVFVTFITMMFGDGEDVCVNHTLFTCTVQASKGVC
jgi:hypothetical protein